jgi:AcrR family transcriptional regulator
VNVRVSQFPAARRRGRPTDPALPGSILAAARGLLFSPLAQGLTMERIAAAAGISKATLYRHFPTLEAVVRAVVEAEREAMLAALGAEAEGGGDLAARLCAFGERLVGFLASPGHLALHRALAAQPGLRAWMGPLIWRDGIVATERRLAAILAEGGRREAGREARALLGAWQGNWLLGLLLEARAPPDAAEIAAIARDGVAAVLGLPAAG